MGTSNTGPSSPSGLGMGEMGTTGTQVHTQARPDWWGYLLSFSLGFLFSAVLAYWADRGAWR